MSDQSLQAEFDEFLLNHPYVERLEVLLFGQVGGAKGKLLPRAGFQKLLDGAVRLPLSAATSLPWGADIDGLPIVDEWGDFDGPLVPVSGTLSLVPWASSPTAQVLVTHQALENPYFAAGHSPYLPRNALARAVQALADQGLFAKAATEFEFYLIDPDMRQGPRPPKLPGLEMPVEHEQIYDMATLARFDDFQQAVAHACEEQDLPYEGVLSEYGPGQFEVNLAHADCPLVAADQAQLLKRLIKAVAHDQGFEASFMPKPYANQPGNGLHVHMSLFDESGTPLFASDDGAPNKMLRQVLGGLIELMPDFQLIFAPHLNSYKRFVPGAYAPTTPCWGMDHRGVALRVPSTTGKAARFEHRVSGADANPYLVMVALIWGALAGISRDLDPGSAVVSQADIDKLPELTHHWIKAFDAFNSSEAVSQALGTELSKSFALGRQSEMKRFSQSLTDFEVHSYLTRV